MQKEAMMEGAGQSKVLALVRSRDYWKKYAKRASELLVETFGKVELMEAAYESLHAYATHLSLLLSVENARETARLQGELQDLSLAEVADYDRKAAFGDDWVGKDRNDVKGDAELFKIRLDYYKGLERLRQVLDLPSDANLASAVGAVERLKSEQAQSRQLIVEELQEGSM